MLERTRTRRPIPHLSTLLKKELWEVYEERTPQHQVLTVTGADADHRRIALHAITDIAHHDDSDAYLIDLHGGRSDPILKTCGKTINLSDHHEATGAYAYPIEQKDDPAMLCLDLTALPPEALPSALPQLLEAIWSKPSKRQHKFVMIDDIEPLLTDELLTAMLQGLIERATDANVMMSMTLPARLLADHAGDALACRAKEHLARTTMMLLLPLLTGGYDELLTSIGLPTDREQHLSQNGSSSAVLLHPSGACRVDLE